MKKITITILGIAFITVLTFSLTSMQPAESQGNPAITMQDGGLDLQASIKAGKAIFEGKGTCIACHQKNGAGLPPAFPPLAGADYLLADKDRAIHQAMYGSDEPLTVNGKTYPGGVMTTVDLTNEEVRDVVNYILNSWGNDGGHVTLEEVKAQRK